LGEGDHGKVFWVGGIRGGGAGAGVAINRQKKDSLPTSALRRTLKEKGRMKELQTSNTKLTVEMNRFTLSYAGRRRES